MRPKEKQCCSKKRPEKNGKNGNLDQQQRYNRMTACVYNDPLQRITQLRKVVALSLNHALPLNNLHQAH